MPRETALPPPLPAGKSTTRSAGIPSASAPADALSSMPSDGRASVARPEPPIEAPPAAPPAMPVARLAAGPWWPDVRPVTRNLGSLLRNWRLEARASAVGYSLSMALHAALFLALSLFVIPLRRTGLPEDSARFHCTLDTSIPGPQPGDVGAAGVAFTAAGLPSAPPASRPAGDPIAPAPIAGGADAKPTPALAPPLAQAPSGDRPIANPAPADPVASNASAAPAPSADVAASAAAAKTAASQAAVSAAAPQAPDKETSETTEQETSALVSAARGGFEGRDPARRGEMLARFGGTLTSEAAVTRGLSWLANHQQPDGSWHFNHVGPRCDEYCGNPGSFASTTAATGLALLPFLGAGHTHVDGDYRETVRRGLYYLGDRMIAGPYGGDMQEGTMYSQGIATIALCEAYAMSRDADLKPFAQSALNFIVHAQDPQGGGWRYAPRQPGDTTVTGWQLMALKSGLLAGLDAPQKSFRLVSQFLDHVETDYGAGYGYQKPGSTPTTSAIGLLGRMFTGWPLDHPGLGAGVERLARLGPAPDNMYFNYNATQVMRHAGGETWNKWNKSMREQLIASQCRDGHASGSWFGKDEHGAVGGRLYMTCLAAMTLEVYYRHMPLYGDRATE